MSEVLKAPSKLFRFSTSVTYLSALVALGLLTTCIAAGALRAELGLTLPLSLLLSSATLGVLGIVFWKQISKPSIKTRIAGLLACYTFLFAFIRFYHPDYFGLVSVGGGDAGLHAYFKTRFLNLEPSTYHSFVAFYSLSSALEYLFGLDVFQSFRAAFYLLLFSFIVLMFLLGAAGIRDASLKRSTRDLFVYSVLLYFPAEKILFPIIHYLQAEGFYPQCFGLFALCFCWFLAGKTETNGRRLLLLILSGASIRYTYGLNFPEALFSIATLILVEQRSKSGNSSRTSWVFGIALIVLGITAHLRLAGVFLLEGGTLPLPLSSILFALLFVSGGLAIGLSSIKAAPERQHFLFPFLFVAFSLSMSLLYLSETKEAGYYSYKQILAPIFLGTLAGVSLSTRLALDLMEQHGPQRNRVFACVIIFLGLWLLKGALLPYQPSYRARVQHVKHSKLLEPLIIPEVWQAIGSTLATHRGSFGGYISPRWPESSFTNARFGYFADLLFYHSGRTGLKGKHCLFWQSGKDAEKAYQSLGSVSRTVREFNARPDARSSPLGEHTDASLSYVCED